jgi:preprotein translocase subunit YajC
MCPDNIPYIVHESQMSRMERTIKRLWILCIVIFLALLVLLAVVLIKAKRKRREKMREQLHELFNGQDDGSKE